MPAPTAQALADALRPLTEAPQRAAILCDIDGTLAPIVARHQDARVADSVPELLASLSRSYGVVACVSGRSVADARRLVGVGALGYVGAHGAEVMAAGEREPTLLAEFAEWEPRVAAFVAGRADEHEFRRLRVRLEDKGPIKAFHWRGAGDEAAAEAYVRELAAEAEAAGLAIHWARKVLEVRPPVAVDKGRGVRALLARSDVASALYAGDDVTDLDAFDALDALAADGSLETAVRIGVKSSEGPAAIVQRADLAVDGVAGVVEILAALAESV